METGSNPAALDAATTQNSEGKPATTERATSAVAHRWPTVGGREFPGKGASVEVDGADGWQVRAVGRRRIGKDGGAQFRVTGTDVTAKNLVFTEATFGRWWRWKAEVVPEAAGCAHHGCTLMANRNGFCCAHHDEGAIRGSEPSGVCPGCGKASSSYDHDSGLCFSCEGERRVRNGIGQSIDLLKATHGKGGIPELPAIGALPAFAEQFIGPEVYGPLSKKPQFIPNEPGYPAGPRLCKGVPIYQGPESACDTILGREVKGDRCSSCAEWMASHGDCDGCNGRLPGWQVTGKLCADCCAVRRATLREREGAEQPNDGRWRTQPFAEMLGAHYGELYDALWEILAEQSDLDPKTVAACKMVRDDERKVRR
jgi:hypothetical protein